MTVVFLIVTVGLFLTVEVIRQRRRQVRGRSNVGRIASVFPPEPMRRPFVPHGTFIAAGHSWLRFAPDGTFLMGVDDFVHGALGRVSGIELPPEQTKIQRADPLMTLRTPKGQLVVRAPVDGELVRVNDAALKDCERCGAGPYGLGWLLKLNPVDHKRALERLFVGDGALAFLGREYRRLVDFVGMTSLPAAAQHLSDGGLLERGVLQNLHAPALGAFEDEFLSEY